MTLSASLRALQTPEILAHILSFLPGSDLIAASEVSEFFYDCIAKSPTTQGTLFLHPILQPVPRCYYVYATRVDKDGDFRVHALGLSPFVGLKRDDKYQRAERRLAVYLCPAL
jgi:hypothetical protein